MLARIHVANVFGTTTKNKKLLAGGIQLESFRSNCDVANLVITAKKNNVMAGNIKKLSFKLLSQFLEILKKNCQLEILESS